MSRINNVLAAEIEHSNPPFCTPTSKTFVACDNEYVRVKALLTRTREKVHARVVTIAHAFDGRIDKGWH